MKYSIMLFLCFAGMLANAQTVRKGFTEKLRYPSAGGGTADNFKPELSIYGYVEDKPGLAGQQVLWTVKTFHHHYKTITFIKSIKLTCGNTISKKVTLYDVKVNEIVTGGSFSGDADLSDNIFKEDCNKPNRIADISVNDIACELDDDDAFMAQFNQLKDDAAKRKKYQEQLAAQRAQYQKLTAKVDSLGGKKDKFDAMRGRFRDLSASVGNRLVFNTPLVQSDDDQIENKLNEIDKLLTDMDSEADNLAIDAQAIKDKAKESNRQAATTTSTYAESDKARELRARSGAQNAQNTSEDALASNASAGVNTFGGIVAGSGESDYEDEEYPVVLRATLGTEYKFFPVIKNYFGNGFDPKSEVGTTSPTSFNLGLDAKFFHDQLIGFNINPFYSYGSLALSSSTGSMSAYGANGNIKIGRALQLVLKGGYEARTGNDSYDAAEIGIDGTTTASYDFYSLKYGAGLRYKFLEFAVMKEDVTSNKDYGKNLPAYSYQLNMEAGWFGMKIRYSNGYPATGTLAYPEAFDAGKKESLMEFGIYWRMSVFHND